MYIKDKNIDMEEYIVENIYYSDVEVHSDIVLCPSTTTTQTNTQIQDNDNQDTNPDNKTPDTNSTIPPATHPTPPNIKTQIILFDMDETLGHFSQLGLICGAFEIILQRPLTIQNFIDILETYKYYLRPNIMTILKFIKNKKEKNPNMRVAIYTNNSAPSYWTYIIQEYFHYKLNYKLFDTTILSYQFNGGVREKRRTTQEKTIEDVYTIFDCVPKETSIIFIDDQIHNQMIRQNVYYILVDKYVYNYSISEIMEKFNLLVDGYTREEYDTFLENITYPMEAYYGLYNAKNTIENNDLYSSKQVLRLLDTFFQMRIHRTTRKKRTHYSQKNEDT